MKTFSFGMNRARWISLLIAILCIVLIVMMLSPYFTYGQSATTLVPSNGAQEMLFGKSWVIEGTSEGDENYKELVMSKDGKNSTLKTSNKLRVNQQYALSVFNAALANYETMETNVDDCKAYEEQAWASYLSIGNTCNKLARAMGKPEFVLKDKATEVIADEEAGEEEGGEAAAEEEEEELMVLSQEGDPYAEDYKALSTAMKTANRQLETAIKSRVTAEECRDDAKAALDSAYEACLAVYSCDANGEALGEDDPNRIDPSYAWVRVKSSEYYNALTENFEDEFIAAVISVKSDDFKKWLVDENHYINEYAAFVKVTEQDVLAASCEALLNDVSARDAFLEGFVKPDSAEFKSFVDANVQAALDKLYADKLAGLTEADYEKFVAANQEDFKDDVLKHKDVLTEKIWADLTDNTRTKAAYIKALNNAMYKAFINSSDEHYQEFAAYAKDSSRKGEITDALFNMYMNGEKSEILDTLLSDFMATKQAAYKEFAVQLAIDGADAKLNSELEKIAKDNKQTLYQGNLKIMYASYAEDRIEEFKKNLAENYPEDLENVQYELYVATKDIDFKAWLDDEANDAAKVYSDAFAAKLKNADKKKERENFYKQYYGKLDKETKEALRREFFEATEPGLNDADRTKVYTEMNDAILAGMSAEDRDKVIYSELDNMLKISNAAYAKAQKAQSKTDNAIKNGQASKTSKKAQKAVENIDKQAAKVQPIFDEVDLITKKEAKYNALLQNETLKDEVFARFIAENGDLFDSAVLKEYEGELKEMTYGVFEKAIDGNALSDLEKSWNAEKGTFLGEKKDQLDVDSFNERFILEQHNAEFKDWLYEQADTDVKATAAAVVEDVVEDAADDAAQDAEEGDSEVIEEAEDEADDSIPAAKLSYSELYMEGKADPNKFEATQTEPLLMESPATVKYSKRANEDVATVTIEYANGEKKETSFATEVKYDGIQKLSILGFVAFPEDYANTFEATKADYKILQYGRNSVVLMPILLFILLIVSIVLAFVKRDNFVSGICPAAAGCLGVLAFLFSTFLKLGDKRVAFVILFALLFVISVLQIYLCIKAQKRAAAESMKNV